jgi:hypothetical protein
MDGCAWRQFVFHWLIYQHMTEECVFVCFKIQDWLFSEEKTKRYKKKYAHPVVGLGHQHRLPLTDHQHRLPLTDRTSTQWNHYTIQRYYGGVKTQAHRNVNVVQSTPYIIISNGENTLWQDSIMHETSWILCSHGNT